MKNKKFRNRREFSMVFSFRKGKRKEPYDLVFVHLIGLHFSMQPGSVSGRNGGMGFFSEGVWPYLRARALPRSSCPAFFDGSRAFFYRIRSVKIGTVEKCIPVASLLNLSLVDDCVPRTVIFTDIPPGADVFTGLPDQMGDAYAQYQICKILTLFHNPISLQ
jgi:hypothetical protein